MDKSYWPPGSLPKEEFSWKNFLGSKGAKGLESIFKYVPESMKVSFLKGMHKMHPMQAEEFMRKMFWDNTTSAGWDEWVMDTTRHLWGPDEGNKTYGLWQGPVKPKDYNVIYDYWPARAADLDTQELFRRKLRDPNLSAADRKLFEDMLKYGATDDAKYQMAVMEQQMKLNPDMDAERALMDDAIKYQTALHDQQNKVGKVIDFETKKRQMTPKGIPWSKIGMKILNHPVTQTMGKGARFIGGVGDVALGGMAYSDMMAGTNFVGDTATNINKWAGSKFKNDGTVSHQLNLNSSPIQPKYNMPPQGAAGFNRGGIVSLVI